MVGRYVGCGRFTDYEAIKERSDPRHCVASGRGEEFVVVISLS